MRFEAIEILPYMHYGFIIETKEKPEEALKERIREQIGEAMGALGREPESYSVTVCQGYEESLGEREFPEFGQSRNYLLFALRSGGDSAEPLSPRELEEEREELARGIFAPRESRIALVLLQDSSISLIRSDNSPIVGHGI